MRNTLLILTLLVAPWSAQAEIYKWTDANGKVHFSDQPPAQTKQKHETVAPPKVNGFGGSDVQKHNERSLITDRNESGASSGGRSDDYRSKCQAAARNIRNAIPELRQMISAKEAETGQKAPNGGAEAFEQLATMLGQADCGSTASTDAKLRRIVDCVSEAQGVMGLGFCAAAIN